MQGKKAVSWVVGLTLWVTMLLPYAGAAGESTTLKEPPYSIGDGWVVDTTYNSSMPYSLAFGKNEYVAVGPYGTVMKSEDGRNWKALSKFGRYQLTAIDWDGTKYIMFGTAADDEQQANYMPSEAFASADGLHWEKLDFEPGEAIHSLVWGGDAWVATGREHVFTSADGDNWTQTLTFKAGYGYNAVVYVNHTYFITSYEDNAVYVSKDGRSWTAKPLDLNANIQQMVWTGEHYLGAGNGIYTSKDGTAWTKQSGSPKNESFQVIVTDGSTYIAAGASQRTGETTRVVSYTSKDGKTWTKQDASGLGARALVLYPVDGGFAGLASNKTADLPDGTYSIFTKNGSQWSTKLVGTSIAGDLRGIATNGKRTVAVGIHGTVLYTDNGTTWHGGKPFPYKVAGDMGMNLFDVAWGAGKFVAVGNAGAYYSTDGTEWKKANVTFRGQYGDLENILWTGSFFVASSQVDGVYTSKDGVNWTKVKGMNDWLTSMIWDGKRVVASFQVFNNGNPYTNIMSTTNGTTWTKLAKIDFSDLKIAWNEGKYIAYFPYGRNMWVSADAKLWTKVDNNLDDQDRFEFAMNFDGHFVAFNDSIAEVNGEYLTYNAYYTSEDGKAWREIPVPDKQSDAGVNEMMMDGVYAHGKYIFVGAAGLIMYNSDLQLEEPIIIKVQGKTLDVSPELGKPYIANGAAYVPLKIIGSALGYEVIWNAADQSVTFQKGEEQVPFHGAILKNGRSYVPLRKISERLGYQVNYERINQEAVITIE